MKKNKLLLLLLIVPLLFITACSDKDAKLKKGSTSENLENLTESGMPIVEDQIKLKIFAGRTPQSAEDWNDVLIWNTYEEMTNIDVEWEMVQSTGLEEKRNLALASGTLPDAFHTASIPTVDLLKYGEQGVFIPLNDLIEEHAPNLKKVLDEYPEVEKAITFPDGNIYSFPTVVDPNFLSMLLGPRPWVNQEWLDTLSMEMPQTTEDYYEYLKAVKTKDPNGNGKADEIPFGSYSIDMMIRWLNGAYGLGNRGFNHPYIDMDPAKEELRFIPTSEEYKAMIEYLHKLYNEGLIEQNIFSMETGQFLANSTEGLYGSTVSHSPRELFGVEEYSGAPALEGPFKDKLFTGITPMVTSINGFVITSENKNPAATVRWMDYFYSDEGSKLFLMGVEGETYEETSDGELKYLDKITNSTDGLTFEQELAKYLTWPGGGYPGLVKEEYFKGLENAEDSRKSAEKLEPYIIDEVWPSFTYTKEENDLLASIGTDIQKYVIEMRDKFISGDIPLSEWDSYTQTVKDMGLEDYLKVQKQALERYKSN
ncbi:MULTISPECIES: extracellular solute-binding protein [Clostridia]|uniref:extracellular solute-binding protein n=1 Tax=Clostridia TaxID=186801 RepID=UPI000EA181B1|nr:MULTISPECIES: extracellular solute-binding protein [Clostridia]NBJ68842.1 extracellular solute-binding protein [Roseburia sp. 1XD42-34]RKI80220.1 extracellular solute-binding protein [Clostridium sp. 1xD42-85]